MYTLNKTNLVKCYPKKQKNYLGGFLVDLTNIVFEIFAKVLF